MTEREFDFYNGYQCAREKYERQSKGWEYLKECITDMCNDEGTLNQKQTCQFILNLMEIIEKEGKKK